ncbi:MAG: hypothetical protein DRJ67_00635 [Thermoprotei archaeon]|nr:MAG: hypothetical protein DRJ67_00635 [Thermoprotei archaeon]
MLDRELGYSEYLLKVRRHSAGGESEDHLALKVLAIRNLVEREGVRLDNIESEYGLCGGRVVADVYVKSRGLAVEVETLSGAGPAPILSIRDSAMKYVEHPGCSVSEVWVVVRPQSALLHALQLLKLRRALEEVLKEGGVKLKMLVATATGELRDVYEVVSRALEHAQQLANK